MCLRLLICLVAPVSLTVDKGTVLLFKVMVSRESLAAPGGQG